MALKKWIVNTPDKELAKELAAECEVDPFVAMLACARGCNDASELEQFLNDEPLLCDPQELIDINKAADAVNNAIAEDMLIAVFGDYDCDGVCATAILYDYLISRGARVVTYIPERLDEGYGMNCDAIDKLSGMGVQLIITVDNGIACFEEIEYANSLGIQTVVTDHHLPPERIPDAIAVVDPHRKDCPSTFKEICGASVAFKLVCVTEDLEPEQMLHRYADLLAIATVGDVMPLVNENRSVVREGIRLINKKPRTGVSALISAAGLERGKINSGNVSFGLVPRINAAGRMGSAKRALKLLTETDMMSALNIANEIDADNNERQKIERNIVKEACQQIEDNKYEYQRVIVVCGKDWHPGVLGIAASRIVEKYGKPAIVLSERDGYAEGSARSFAGFSLYDALSYCSETLEKFGGHALAAGMGLKYSDLEAFRCKINEYAETVPYAPQVLSIDLRLNPVGLSVDMADALSILEPFGCGNPAPIFGIFGVTLDKITPIGNGKHLKLLFSKNGAVFQALLFGVAPEVFCFEIGDVLDLAVTLSANEYQGVYSLSIQIKALRINGIDDDKLFCEVASYHNFIANDIVNDIIVPTREQVGEIYRMLCVKPILPERLKYLSITKLGFAKTSIAVTVLKELGLICEENGKLSVVKGASKTQLEQSNTYFKLTKGGNEDE